MPEPTMRPMTCAEVLEAHRLNEERRNKIFGYHDYDRVLGETLGSRQWWEAVRDQLALEVDRATTEAARANRLRDLADVIEKLPDLPLMMKPIPPIEEPA